MIETKGGSHAAQTSRETVPLFIRRAALADIEAEETPRPIEYPRIFYFALRTPGIAWATDQNGRIPEYLKGILHAATSSEFLHWLAATQSI